MTMDHGRLTSNDRESLPARERETHTHTPRIIRKSGTVLLRYGES